ncbi:hypothetical protein PL263_14755 [Methylomonas sp. EFPC3]|uniref:hypothetical protein n=1 Tax=Methylomonas TaxID=416 RepID=UPI00164318A1|nr:MULTISPECIES: hypothetical protein [Methylomonas]WFP49353.1 hypothetical protein PL263_14755 [Methylomonas sp. EFPC3]
MNEFKKDVLVGTLFVAGILNFLSGLFVISTVLFAATSMFSNISLNTQASR